MKQIRHRLLMVFLAVLVLGTGSYAGVQAYSGTVFGRGSYEGYFSGDYDEYGGFVLPVIANAQAIPDYIDSVPELIQLLKDANSSGNAQRVTGSAFIVYTMLGRPGANYNKDVSDTDWNDLTARMNDRQALGKIDWDKNASGNINSFWQGKGSGPNPDDDAFFTESGKSGPGILFYNDDGSKAYQLLRECANPMGDQTGLPNSKWDLSASSSVSQGTAKPGDTVVWSHQLRNNGPSNTTTNVHSNLSLGGFTNGWPGTVADGDTGAGAGVGVIRTIPSYATYTIGQNDVGNTLCERVNFSPAGSAGGGGSGNTACVSVPYNYNLTPQVSLNGQTTIEAGGQASISNTVTNSGATKTRDTDWRLTRMIYQPGTNLSAADKAARDSGGDPCGTFTGGGRTGCDIVQQDDTRVFMPGTTTFVPIYKYIADSTLSTGTQVCFAVSVSRPTQDPNPVWRHSQLACMMVSKKPKLQVHGGDIRVGGRIETGLSTVTSGGATKTYGSWVEYGALSIGPNSGFASGSGLNTGGAAVASAWNRLTFANIDDSGVASYGNYAMPPRFASLVGQFTAATPSGGATSSLSGLGSGTYSAGNLTITGSSIGQDAGGNGKSIIILASGTVTINGNIKYVGPGGGANFTKLSQIPQVVIIAGNINITGAVKNVDAWLMTSGATGAVNTCSDLAVGAALNSTVCDNVLKVNGPVVTSHLYLRRTAGADDGTRAGDPAEVFNLRADTNLWQQSRSTEAGKAQTVYTSELPPRF